jgi:SAM-dependent methyltransferase
MTTVGPHPVLARRDHPWADAELARLYDAFPFAADLPLHLDVIERTGKRVLEVGCGTGRLLLPLARAGCRLVGVDASPAMLALADRKLANAGEDVRLRASLVEGDMRTLRLDEEFDVALLPVKTFAYLTSRADQLAALSAIVGHLRPGGRFVLDLLNPAPAWLAQPDGSVRQDVTGEVDGVVVTRTETAVSTDLAAQVRVLRSAYEVIAPTGSVRKRIVEWPFRWTHRFEAEHLLERAGLEVEHVYGGYVGEPFTSDSPALLLVGRCPS